MANPQTKTDEQVLQDPGSATVEEVLAVFARSSPEQVAAAQELEAAGQGRKTIAEYTPPEPEPDPNAQRYSRERLLGFDGQRITGYSGPELAGALHDVDGDDFTRRDIDRLVAAFLKRPATQEA